MKYENECADARSEVLFERVRRDARFTAALEKVAPCSYYLGMRSLKTAGIKELKNKLSAYLREVRSGSTILVSDHGEIIAEIRSPSPETMGERRSSAVDELARDGLVTLPSAGKEPLAPPPVTLPRGTSQAILDADRG